MQYANSDLENLVPLWDRELPHRLNKLKTDSLRGGDIDVLCAPVREHCVGDLGPLAQDAFRARVIRQGAIKVVL